MSCFVTSVILKFDGLSVKVQECILQTELRLQDKLDPNQTRLSAITFASSAKLHFNLEDCPYIQDLVGDETGRFRLPDNADPGGCIGDIR